MSEFLTFPYRLTQAVVKGLGRLIVETWDRNVFQENPYINMTPEQRLEIEETDRGQS